MRKIDWRTASFAQRLEHARVKVAGINSWKELQRRLCEENVFEVHYNTIINYHTHTVRADKRREPSIDYMMRVCDVLAVRPEWLLLGKGKPTAAEMATDAAEEVARGRGGSADAGHGGAAWAAEVDRRFDEAFPGTGRHEQGAGEPRRIQGPGTAAHAQLWRVWAAVRGVSSRIAQSRGELERMDDPAVDAADAIECAEQVVRAVLAPLKEIDALPPRSMDYSSLGAQPDRDMVHLHSRAASSAEQTVSTWTGDVADLPYYLPFRAADSKRQFFSGMHGDQLDSFIISTCENLLSVLRRQEAGLADAFYRQEQPRETDEEPAD
jgi:hypothetical protein